MFDKGKGPSLGGLAAYSKNRKKHHGPPSAPTGGMVHGKPDGDMGEPDADDMCPHCGGPMGGGMGGGPPMPPPMKGMR